MPETIKSIMTTDGAAQIDYEYLANKPTVDTEPTENSENLITSGAVYSACSSKSDNAYHTQEAYGINLAASKWGITQEFTIKMPIYSGLTTVNLEFQSDAQKQTYENAGITMTYLVQQGTGSTAGVTLTFEKGTSGTPSEDIYPVVIVDNYNLSNRWLGL